MIGPIPALPSAMAPLPPQKKRTIIVDRGHGERIYNAKKTEFYNNPGAICTYPELGTLQEHDVVKPALDDFVAGLKRRDMEDGVEDYTLIYTDSDTDIETRKRLKEQYPDSVFVSFHANQWFDKKQSPTQTKISGLEVYGYSDGGRNLAKAIAQEASPITQELYCQPAKALISQAFRVITVPDYDKDGIDGKHKDLKTGKVVMGDKDDNARDYSALIELGYLNNPNDAKVLADPNAMAQMGDVIAQGVHCFIQQ